MKNLQVIRPAAKRVILTCAEAEYDKLEVEQSLAGGGLFFTAQSGTDDSDDHALVTVLAPPQQARALVREMAAMVGYDVVDKE